MDKREYIKSEFSKADIAISDTAAEKFLKYYEFLVEYNEMVNLTAITEFSEVVVKHFVDSVLPFTFCDINKGATFADVGTGAGFPAIPLMIYRPDLKCTLVEALNKRCVFLEKLCELIDIKAEISHSRAEDFAKNKREKFDIVTARAVAALPVLAEYCMPLVKVGGELIALKSVNEDITSAEKAVKVLGGEKAVITDYKIPNGDDRRLVVVKKISQTPTIYPRNPGVIKKKPL